MVSSICKAKDKRTCPYHGAVIRMNEAQDATPPDWEGYFVARTQVEDYEKRGWAEESEVNDFASSLTSNASSSQTSGSEFKGKQDWTGKSADDVKSILGANFASTDMNDAVNYYDSLEVARLSGLSEGVYLEAKKNALEKWVTFRQADAIANSEHPTNFDAEVLNGKVLDTMTVVNDDGYAETFYRRREGVYAAWPYSMRFQANRPLSDEESNHLAQLIGYQYRSTVRGESMGDPERDTPYSFVMSADTTKTSSDDLGMALERFEDGLNGTVQEGSPVRTTNRSGPKGTRLVDGFNDPDLKIEIYYDSV